MGVFLSLNKVSSDRRFTTLVLCKPSTAALFFSTIQAQVSLLAVKETKLYLKKPQKSTSNCIQLCTLRPAGLTGQTISGKW